MIKAILAADAEWGIGKNNILPWSNNSDDLRWFKQITHEQTVVMGRNTWESLPIKPLPGRYNIVVSSNPVDGPDLVISLQEAKSVLQYTYPGTQKWIIGGAMLVEALMPIIDEIWISRIEGTHGCDTFLPSRKIATWYHRQRIPHNTLDLERWVRR